LLFHLKITELLLKATYCVDGRLLGDMTVICFQGGHEVLYGVAVTLLILYSLGYPLATLAVLCRAHREKQAKKKRKQRNLKLHMEQPAHGIIRHRSIRMGRTMAIHDLGQVTTRTFRAHSLALCLYSSHILLPPCLHSSHILLTFYSHSTRTLLTLCAYSTQILLIL
jgi:hypothetical protein